MAVIWIWPRLRSALVKIIYKICILHSAHSYFQLKCLILFLSHLSIESINNQYYCLQFRRFSTLTFSFRSFQFLFHSQKLVLPLISFSGSSLKCYYHITLKHVASSLSCLLFSLGFYSTIQQKNCSRRLLSNLFGY